MRKIIAFLFLLGFVVLPTLAVEPVSTGERNLPESRTLWLRNGLVQCSLELRGNFFYSDRLATLPGWPADEKAAPLAVETDADFLFEVMWTDWRAPGRQNNADNPVRLSKRDFVIVSWQTRDLGAAGKALDLEFKGNEEKDVRLRLRVSYWLEPGAFYVRRQVALSDPYVANHFLQMAWPYYALVAGDVSVEKRGDFGQPAALRISNGGAFFGIEYPAAQNYLVEREHDRYRVSCSQEIGERIGQEWLAGEWVVFGISPDAYVKLWFSRYLERIRVAPLRPYTLYNSWYDLRSPQYPKITPEHVMNSANIQRIISLLRQNMIEKHGINLDAFVLDDGWDVYASDWLLRSEQFPGGLAPIAAELAKNGIKLGLWFGPIGGYSFRRERVEWMRGHGYETVEDQLCLAGKNYRELFKKRVTDFAGHDGVAYFKWDGIQFSCSEPDHGHLPGLFSRRAVVTTLIDLCRAVREKNPEMYLNVTSGTWLSPWWLKYANQIWMDGEDYGYADVPSISPRDSAITYRDFVLYEDFKIKDLWFPIANLMTHGIIKGRLQMLGGENEPLEKFTDEALLYLARGVSMWELYISPDILSEDEWQAMAASIRWAKDRFPVLRQTEMIGGDPKKREAYGYIHALGKRAIVALRNPGIESQTIRVVLSPAYGLAEAASLVVEKVYPERLVAAELVATGATLSISLDGYETAIYEIYPLVEAAVPLLAGVPFGRERATGRDYAVTVYPAAVAPRLLNPELVQSASIAGRTSSLNDFPVFTGEKSVFCRNVSLTATKNQDELEIKLDVAESARSAMLAVLWRSLPSGRGDKMPQISVKLDGLAIKAESETQSNLWTWISLPLSAGAHRVQMRPQESASGNWAGQVQAWLVCRVLPGGQEVVLVMKDAVRLRPMPPRPWPEGEVRRYCKLGEVELAPKNQ